MPNMWIQALTEYNSKHKHWCVPKKGSKEHQQVMRIMNKKKADTVMRRVEQEKGTTKKSNS